MTFSVNVAHGTNRRLHFGGASDYRMLLPGPSSPTSVLVLLQRYLCSSPQLLRRRFHVSGLQLRSPALMQTARLGVFVSNDLSERPPEENGAMPRSLHMHEGSWLGFVQWNALIGVNPVVVLWCRLAWQVASITHLALAHYRSSVAIKTSLLIVFEMTRSS